MRISWVASRAVSKTPTWRWLRVVVLFVVVTTALVLLLPRPALACSCAGPPDLDRMVAESPAAFVGTLVSKVPDPEHGPYRSTANPTTYTFDVERWVKGDLGKTVGVRAPLDGAACGIEVPIGGRAGLFVYVEDEELKSSLCATVDAEELLAWRDSTSQGSSTDTTVAPLISDRFTPTALAERANDTTDGRNQAPTPLTMVVTILVIGAMAVGWIYLSRKSRSIE